MKRPAVLLLAAVLAAGVAGRPASADDWVVVPAGAAVLPTVTPNGPGLLVPPDLSTPPAVARQLTPDQLAPMWHAAGRAYGIPWQVLAAINKVESDFGRNMGPSPAGAVGSMQFMPATWMQYGTDADADGVADPWNALDAIYSAARYLAASGGQADLRSAVFAYNHADWYVDEVLQIAASYGLASAEGSPVAPAAPEHALPAVEPASTEQEEQAVAEAEAALADGQQRVAKLEAAERTLGLDASAGDLLGDRLEAAQDAAQAAVDLAEARAEVTDLRARVDAARAALDAAQETAAAAAAAVFRDPASPTAPISSGEWVFPVAGGPSIASVTPQQDGSTTEIPAPAGTPAYALAQGQVTEASPEPQGDCGIGFTLQTSEGRSWTYCHLAYLDPAVTPAASLPAGAQVGLVGQTGSASASGLAVSVDAGAPLQNEPWFADLAGRAFRWESVPAAAPVFSVVPS